MTLWQLLFVLPFLIMALTIYFGPTGVAINRKHPQTTAIFVLNLLLGWTMIGWVAAMVWAFIAPQRPAYYREIGPGQFVPVFEYETTDKTPR